MKRICVLLLLIALIAVVWFAYAKTESDRRDSNKAAEPSVPAATRTTEPSMLKTVPTTTWTQQEPLFQSEDPAQIIADCEAAELAYASTTQQAIAALGSERLRGPKFKRSREALIMLLGKLRAVEAVEELVRHLPITRQNDATAESQGALAVGLGELLGGPASDALLEIGLPAVPKLIESVRKHEDDQVRVAIVLILKRLIDKRVLLSRLEADLQASTDESERDNLKEGISTVRRLIDNQ